MWKLSIDFNWTLQHSYIFRRHSCIWVAMLVFGWFRATHYNGRSSVAGTLCSYLQTRWNPFSTTFFSILPWRQFDCERQNWNIVENRQVLDYHLFKIYLFSSIVGLPSIFSLTMLSLAPYFPDTCCIMYLICTTESHQTFDDAIMDLARKMAHIKKYKRYTK